MIEILDGGMIFELNKYYNDLGQEALLRNPKIIELIYQSYIDLGCQYITTCNYGFKSLKLENWKDLVNRSVEICSYLKTKNKKIKILGCLPPYHESYHNGEVNNKFLDFYKFLIATMIGKVDYFICETQISINHINAILAVLEYYQKYFLKKTKILISIYPNSNINGKELTKTILTYKHLIEGLMVNCCSFNDMISFYNENLLELNLGEKNIKFGFYCNMLDEKKYSCYSGNKKENFKLDNFKNKEILNQIQLYNFLDYLVCKNIKVIVGGCCGYGVKEMTNLVSLINGYNVLRTARL